MGKIFNEIWCYLYEKADTLFMSVVKHPVHVAPPDSKLFGTLVLLRPIKKLPMHGYQKTELLPLELPWRYHGQKFGIEIYIYNSFICLDLKSWVSMFHFDYYCCLGAS